jgi:hypothetical protein
MRFIVLGFVALVFLACSKSEPAPSSASSTPLPPSDVARPTSQALAPFAVGQWAKYKVHSGEGSTSQLMYKIVGQEEGAHWLEIVRGEPNAGNVLQLLVSVKDRSDANSLEIKAAKILMPNRHVRDIRGRMLEPMADGYKRALADSFLPALGGAPQKDVTVPAGTFHGCYQVKQNADTKQGSTSYDACVHPAVPISGVVRSEQVGGKSKTELVGYGMTGAVSDLQHAPSE